MIRNEKTATVGSSREIWCSNRETGRFHEKLGDSRENRESWQVSLLKKVSRIRLRILKSHLQCIQILLIAVFHNSHVLPLCKMEMKQVVTPLSMRHPPPNPVTETFPSANILENVGLRNPEVT